ncbi:tRNA-dihydrouridine synthase, partial [Acinetobacter baumannii]
RLFEAAGIAMLTVHGRTREQGYKGLAEYDTIAAVKTALTIPVVANGDIDSPEKAREVLAYTGADALMIGRAAQGRPWIFREVAHFLAT